VTTELQSRIREILRKHESELMAGWMRQQQESIGRRRDLISDAVGDMLGSVSRSRSPHGREPGCSGT